VRRRRDDSVVALQTLRSNQITLKHVLEFRI
jgi:hypothetical protein